MVEFVHGRLTDDDVRAGWLEPMAQRIKEDPTVVQLPRNSGVIT
jgi:hypothetical protein